MRAHAQSVGTLTNPWCGSLSGNWFSPTVMQAQQHGQSVCTPRSLLGYAQPKRARIWRVFSRTRRRRQRSRASHTQRVLVVQHSTCRTVNRAVFCPCSEDSVHSNAELQFSTTAGYNVFINPRRPFFLNAGSDMIRPISTGRFTAG